MLEHKIADLRRRAHSAAFSWYIRKGFVPVFLTEVLEATASLENFRKYNPYHKPAGTPEGGQFDSAPGGGSSGGSSPKPSARNIYRDFPDPDYVEPGLGNAREVDAAIVAGLMLAMNVPALAARGAAGIVASAVRSRLARTLMPGGKLIGKAGRSPRVRELSGGYKAAEKMFKALTKGGSVSTPPGFTKGVRYTMPDGSHITYRPSSTSGPPTIDVNLPLEKRVIKLKFLGGD
jgi:hypothetical protein